MSSDSNNINEKLSRLKSGALFEMDVTDFLHHTYSGKYICLTDPHDKEFTVAGFKHTYNVIEVYNFDNNNKSFLVCDWFKKNLSSWRFIVE